MWEWEVLVGSCVLAVLLRPCPVIHVLCCVVCMYVIDVSSSTVFRGEAVISVWVISAAATSFQS